MDKKVKYKTITNPYDTIRHLAGATHVEVQYFLPYLKAWLPEECEAWCVGDREKRASPGGIE